MRFLARNLDVFVLVSELRFCKQILALCSTLVLQDTFSTVKHKVLRTSKLPIFKTYVSPQYLSPFSRFAMVSRARRKLFNWKLQHFRLAARRRENAKTTNPQKCEIRLRFAILIDHDLTACLATLRLWRFAISDIILLNK